MVPKSRFQLTTTKQIMRKFFILKQGLFDANFSKFSLKVHNRDTDLQLLAQNLFESVKRLSLGTVRNKGG